MSAEGLDALVKAHPALIDSVTRWRGVGGWGATATILRILEVGAISVELEHGCLSLHLVPGVSIPKRPHASSKCVEHGHVEGLSSFDRRMLTMLFDDIAREPVTDLAQLSAFRNAHPLAFWTRLKGWRDEVDTEAKRLRSCGRLSVNNDLIYEIRPQLVDMLHDEAVSNRQWSRIAAVAVVANLDDVVAKTAKQRWAGHADAQLSGPAAVVWLCSIQSGKRSGVDVLRHLFSPLRPSSYAPAQYVTLRLPPDKRLRVVDDGSLRLGG